MKRAGAYDLASIAAFGHQQSCVVCVIMVAKG
jgi:hypothetical protein